MNENVLITPSPYTTLLYFLVNDLQKIHDTAYFFVRYRKWTQDEITKARELLPQSYFLNEPKITIRCRRDYTYLEDGLFTYGNADIYAGNASCLRRLQIFLDALFAVRGLGVTRQAKKIILTGLAEIPKCYRKKNLDVVSMPDLWEKSEPGKKRSS